MLREAVCIEVPERVRMSVLVGGALNVFDVSVIDPDNDRDRTGEGDGEDVWSNEGVCVFVCVGGGVTVRELDLGSL